MTTLPASRHDANAQRTPLLLERVLAEMYQAGTISFDSAMAKTSRPEELQRILEGGPKAASATQQAAAAGRRR